MIVDDQAVDIIDKFDLFVNNYSVQYHTFYIYKESHIYEQCNHLNKTNFSFIKFVIHDPVIIIDANFKNALQSQYNVVDILVEYDIEPILDRSDNPLTDSTSLSELCEKLNIKTDDLYIDNSTHTTEKLQILFSLLNLMFEKRETTPTNVDKVIETIKKYMLK